MRRNLAMEKTETFKILGILNIAYPKYEMFKDKEQLKLTIDLW